MKPILHEIHLLLMGLLYQEDPHAEHATLDPIRLLLLTFAIAALATGRFTAPLIALITAFTIGRILAAYRDGTIKVKNDP